jgi:hypothetical protein
MNPKRRLAAALAAGFFLFFHPAAHAASAQADTQSRINSTARLIAGLAPSFPEHWLLTRIPQWKEHRGAMLYSFNRVEQEQAVPLFAWRDSVFPQNCPVSETLFYPFSGPDFFNMYWLFPECSKYVLFGLEPIGTVPAVDTLQKERFVGLLLGVREAMANLFARNYFITSRMGKQMKAEELNGVVPIFMIQMALSGVEIVSIEPLVLDPIKPAPAKAPAVQDPNARPPHELKGVSIRFRRPYSHVVQELHYFSVDVSNKGIRNYPEFIKYIRDLGPTATLVKSASYLMHIDQFTRIRDLLLNMSQFLVQDDSGVPYSELVKRNWSVRVFGRYQEPIPPFERHFQPALAEQYETQNPKQLTFRFGYRRASEGDERTNVMVAVRASAIAKQSGAGDAGRTQPSERQ